MSEKRRNTIKKYFEKKSKQPTYTTKWFMVYTKFKTSFC